MSISKVTFIAAAILLLVSATLGSNDRSPIPGDPSSLNSWFQANVKPYAKREGTLDPSLETAEAKPRTIKVRKDGNGDFKTLTDAVKSIPLGNTQRVIVDIGAGVYNEKIQIEKQKPFVTFKGSASSTPTLTFAGTARVFGTVYSATLQVDSDYFVASNIIIKNSAPRPSGKLKEEQAVALRIGGDKAAFYNCRLIGFQDTLCDDKGRHFFKNCYIEGTVDFIFGSGRSLYLGTEINVLADQGLAVITAQARYREDDSGFSFVHCKVNGIGKGAFLGRAWTERPRVVFAFTTMSSVVNPAGWSDNLHPERDRMVSFGEYKCKGPGSNPSSRVKFSKQLTPQQANAFISLAYIEGSKWLLPPPN
ncbi:unnamed protein product [Dovyalis caffra]|uniref:Pectinesterase n=1 Tax=Dovyalis caffra TaxID=77055 RepID=A0AAV1RKC6_9ROSI|nr:unnamed protein product [Dovyalis caffra]